VSPTYRPGNAKLMDCESHGPGSGGELLLVEGDSALASVCAVRQAHCQAVLALQGKPLNAWQASAARVAQHPQYRLLVQALGLAATAAAAPTSDAPYPAQQRFDRVVLLFDPDADGIHIGALMVLYFQRWLPALIAQQQLWLVRPPMFELVAADTGDVQQADNPAHCHAIAQQMTLAAGGARPQVQAYRGLGGIAPQVLRSRCVDPATRRAHVVTAADVRAVRQVFGRGRALP
jgi:DNA gyrase subunit B